MIRSLALALILTCLLCAVPVHAADAAPSGKEPDLNSLEQTAASAGALPEEAFGETSERLSDYYQYCDGACLMDRNTRQILFQYNGDGRVYPASTTKTMTALLCAKYGNMDDYIMIQYDDYAGMDDPSLSYLQIGGYYSVRSVMKGMLVVSGCEAANAIARYIGGSIPHFVEMMNEEAAALGCTGTHFNSPHGLPDYNHYTTASDMARIASAAMAYPEIRDIVKCSSVYIPEDGQTMYNTNGLLPGSGSYYSYAYCIGVKTGSTSQAGMCLISAAAKNGVELICTVYGAPSADVRYAACTELLEYGFAVDYNMSIDGAQVFLGQESFVYDGTEKRPSVTVTLNGSTLTQGTDYLVEYLSNVQVGQAAVRITGTGYYYGTLTRTFTISSPLPFIDVSTDRWSFPVILDAYQSGLVKGRSETGFEPDAQVSRAEAAVLLHRVMGSPMTPGETTFTDLATVDYAVPAICWAQKAGVLKGRTETEFDPDAPITREELAAMLYRTGAYAPAGLDDRFADRDQISDYAVEAMGWMVREGLLQGRSTEDGLLLLAPRDNATREEITALMVRFRDWRAAQGLAA